MDMLREFFRRVWWLANGQSDLPFIELLEYDELEAYMERLPTMEDRDLRFFYAVRREITRRDQVTEQ